MSIGLVILIVVFVGAVCYIIGHLRAPAHTYPLRVVLHEEESPLWGPRLEDVQRLRDKLVEAGWRHKDWVDDPVHHDQAGRYLYWGD